MCEGLVRRGVVWCERTEPLGYRLLIAGWRWPRVRVRRSWRSGVRGRVWILFVL